MVAPSHNIGWGNGKYETLASGESKIHEMWATRAMELTNLWDKYIMTKHYVKKLESFKEFPILNLLDFIVQFAKKADVAIETITGYCGKLRLLTRDQLTSPSLNSLFTKTTTICETLDAIR